MTIAAGWEDPEQLRYLYNEAIQTIEQLRKDKAELKESFRQIKLLEDSYDSEQEVLAQVFLIAEKYQSN